MAILLSFFFFFFVVPYQTERMGGFVFLVWCGLLSLDLIFGDFLFLFLGGEGKEGGGHMSTD